MILKGNYLKCPKCNGTNTHLVGYAPYAEKDNRLCLNMIFDCEDCGAFSVLVEQHEGITEFTYNESGLTMNMLTGR